MKKLLSVSGIMAITTGLLLVGGGVWGIYFTYQNIARENIITAKDASIPNKPVRGPMTLKAQADVIRMHVLKNTDNKTFAEMPSKIPKLDESGKPMVDAESKEILIANPARETWVVATTLTTALNLGILAYAFSAMTILFGLISLLIGVVFYHLSKK